MDSQDRGESATVASGVCRDLVTGGFVTVWVGLVVDDGIDCVAVAGAAETLSDRAVEGGAVTDAVTAEEPRVTQTAPPNVTPDSASVGTVAVPFTESDDGGPDGVVVAYTPEPAETDRRVVTAAARTLGRHRADSEGVETRFRRAFTRHDVPMLLLDPETDEIRDANDAAAAFYGYDDGELVGRSLREIDTSAGGAEPNGVNTDSRDYTRFEHELASGERRTVEVHSTPVETDTGTLSFAVIHDVTERVAYETELERYRELFENSPVGVFRSRPGADQFEEVNPALVEMTGADSRSQLRATGPAALYDDPDEWTAFAEELLADGVVAEREHRLTRLDGESFWGAVSAIRTETPDGPVFDALIQDVTERVDSEQSLAERTERMEVLNQLLRHDIRNDMAVIGATLDVLEDHVDETGADHLDTLRERTDHVVELTHTARNITETLSVESGESLEAEPVRVDTVLADAVSNASSSFPHAEIRVDGDPPNVTVAATEMLESVFRNLLNNAVQHNDGEPTVVVTATADDDTVTVRVADDGPGVPDKQKQRVFERGEKGPTSDGTGLGLYLVGVLVDSYGGEITVTDNDPQGAVFEVELRRLATDQGFGGMAN
jgi:PAS domain S-box-containing protein